MESRNQRALRFRAWDGTRGEWLHSPDLPISLVGETVMFGMVWVRKDDSHIRMSEMDKIIFEQSTGLRDKQNKEIFEGDVVKFCEGFYERGDDDEMWDLVREVRWLNGQFVPIPMQEECEDSWYSYTRKDFEVIGNIYENPELLK